MNFQIHTSYGEGNTQILQVCKDLSNLVPPIEERLVFDLRNYGETNPFSNLVLINSLRQYRKKHRESDLFCNPKDIGGYLSHIGFYKACGISIGKEPGESRPSSNYVPVTDIGINDANFYDSIDRRARDLAATLQFDSGLQEMLSYNFTETIRNVYEHADTDSVLVAAQKWPSRGLVEIAIADEGCGITGSLNKQFSNDPKELLRLACKPGISAKSNFEYLDINNPWRNSGYGLYIMKELALAYGGSFILCSGKHAIRYYCYNHSEKEIVYETSYSGTAIGIRFRTDTNNDFNSVRRDVITRGQKEAKQIKGAIRKASRSSGGRYNLRSEE